MGNVVIVCRQKKPDQKLLIRGCTASMSALFFTSKLRQAASVSQPLRRLLWSAGLAASCLSAITCFIEAQLEGR